jgi:hypothetical protein
MTIDDIATATILVSSFVAIAWISTRSLITNRYPGDDGTMGDRWHCPVCEGDDPGIQMSFTTQHRLRRHLARYHTRG